MPICSYCNGTGKEPDHKAIGLALKARRKSFGISATDIAGRLKFSKAYISDLELGRRHWSSDLQVRYIKAVNELR